MAGVLQYMLSLKTDKFDGPLETSKQKVTGFDGAAGASTGRLGGLAAGFTGAGAAVGVFGAALALAKSNLESYAEYDGLVRGLKTIDGTAEATSARLAELRNVAKAPGLGFEEAVRGDIRLRSVGLSADLSGRSMKAFGNAIATIGGGKAELDGVLLALTQIESKGVVSAEEINQIAERVPQVRAAMKEAFGTADTQGIQGLGISTTEFIEGLVSQLEKLPQVTSGAQNALDNYDDAWKQLKSTASEFFIGASGGFLNEVTGMINQASKDITALKNLLGIKTPGLQGAGGETESERLATAAAEARMEAERQAYNESVRLANDNTAFWMAKDAERTAFMAVQAEARAAAEEKANLSAQQRIRKAAEDIYAARLTQEENIQRKINELQASGPVGKEAAIAAKDIQAQAEILDRTAQIYTLRKALADLQESAADKAKAEATAAKDKAEAEAKTVTARQLAAALFQEENQILAARADGNTKLAEELQRQANIQKLKLQLMQSQGLTEAAALAAAKQRIALEEGANGKKQRRGILDATASAAQRLARRSPADVAKDARSEAFRQGPLASEIITAKPTGKNYINPDRAAAELARANAQGDPGKVKRDEKAAAARDGKDPLVNLVTSIQTTLQQFATAS